MSAIIREIFWQEYDTTTQIRTVRADIICDSIADLPSGGIMTDYKLDIGSRAKVIADGSEWEIQSSGSWVRQPSKLQLDLTGYATTQYVDTGLSSKVDTSTYTADQAAQDATISTKLSMSQLFGVKSSLQSNTDLDSLTAGAAACSGATVAATLLHCPTSTNAFIIFTDYVAASSRRIQRIYSFNTNTGLPEVFIRSQYSGGWSSWYKFEVNTV